MSDINERADPPAPDDSAETQSLETGDRPPNSESGGLAFDITAVHLAPGAKQAASEFGPFRILEELGRGGQGVVYLAEDTRLGRRVALKVLEYRGPGMESLLLRFKREAAIAAKLKHPGICTVLDTGITGQRPWIAMELIEGESMAKKIASAVAAGLDSLDPTSAQKKLAEETAPTDPHPSPVTQRDSNWTPADPERLRGIARMIEDAARALHAAHEAGIVHRDIKPGNMAVTPEGRVVVLDFGLARDRDSDAMELTQTGDVFGTPAYMSPEQIRAERQRIDRRTDVYSLGVCLFEASTLKRPFSGLNRQELDRAILGEEPTAPRKINRQIPLDLEAIILTALEKDLDRRYATALDLAEDLRRYREHEPVLARHAGPLLKAQRWVQRNTVVAMAATVVFLALLGSAIVFFVKGEEARRERDRANAESREKEIALVAETREREAKETALADRTSALAEKTTALETAERERNAKQIALDNYDRLSDVKRLEAAIAASDPLYPPSPDLVPQLETWQKEHGSLAGKTEGHKKFISELREKALPYSDEERNQDFAPELAALAEHREALAKIEAELSAIGDAAEGSGDEREKKRSALEARRQEASSKLAELEAQTTSGRRSWRFADQALQFQHDVLAELVTNLESFATEKAGPVQSVAKRLAQSQAIARETLEGEIAARWQASQERIKKSEHYSGLDLAPQLGLIPLGPDPDSGLEEFLHWLTQEGPIPERDSKTKKIAVTEELGVVLVLIPGGTFLMGSQKDDPAKPNYDPESQPDEQPVNEVTLAPYFLSKYEMTQAQWLRAFQAEPSQYGPGTGRGDSRFKAPVDARHPVESVSYEDAQLYLPRIGLVLPTEAEWERAARAGRTDQIFAGCSGIADLRRFANISGAETEGIGWPVQAGHEDDFIIHAPVGSFAPNAYGLFDMTGNVWEWCLDGSADRYTATSGLRGLRDDPGASTPRVPRGGCFGLGAADARVAVRGYVSPVSRFDFLGLRPARIIPD